MTDIKNIKHQTSNIKKKKKNCTKEKKRNQTIDPPKMRENRMQRRYGTKHRPCDRETNPLEQKLAMPPDSPRETRIADVRVQHVSAPGVQTEGMPTLIECQAHVHPDERDGTQDGSDEERGTQGGMEGGGRRGHFVCGREDHEDEEVDREEMRFPEEVKKS